MKFSVIVPSYNTSSYIEKCIQSILNQRNEGVDVELVVIDGCSSDGTNSILDRYVNEIDILIIENDEGPAQAINKGFNLLNGDVVSWLNADDMYYEGALNRVASFFKANQDISFCFGKCSIIDKEDQEMRTFITRFKEFFFPVSSRFTYQCINYISQPSLFFRSEALKSAGYLREDMKAAWDYEFILRLWKHGKGACLKEELLSMFRWHESSISGQHFSLQFKEEYESAKDDTGPLSFQALIHYIVRWGIVGTYSLMQLTRRLK